MASRWTIARCLSASAPRSAAARLSGALSCGARVHVGRAAHGLVRPPHCAPAGTDLRKERKLPAEELGCQHVPLRPRRAVVQLVDHGGRARVAQQLRRAALHEPQQPCPCTGRWQVQCAHAGVRDAEGARQRCAAQGGSAQRV